MRKNLLVAALAVVVIVLVYSDITVRRGADGWCGWWRSNVKVCSVDVDITVTKAAAVCSTDSDCAAWEVANNIPVADRTYGDPVPARKVTP